MFELFNRLVLENEIIDCRTVKRHNGVIHLLCVRKDWAAN